MATIQLTDSEYLDLVQRAALGDQLRAAVRVLDEIAAECADEKTRAALEHKNFNTAIARRMAQQQAA